MREVRPPPEVCDKRPRAKSKRKRLQRRTPFSDSFSSAITEDFDDKATNDEDKIMKHVYRL